MDRPTTRLRPLLLLIVAVAAPATLGYAQQQSTQSQGDTVVQPPAQIAISPGKVEVEIGARPSVEALTVMNFGDRDIDVDVSVVPWDLDESNRVRVLAPTEQSLDQWLIFNPRTFRLPARSEQTIRFSVRPRAQPADGEHRAMIYFRERPAEGGEGRVQVIFKIGVAVYAYAGEVERTGIIHKVQVASDASLLGAAFDIESKGNAHVRMHGQFAVWPVEQFPGAESLGTLPLDDEEFQLPEPMLMAGWLPNTPVLGGTRRQVYLGHGHQLPPGRYVLALNGQLAGEEFRDAVAFSVPVPPVGVTDGQAPGGDEPEGQEPPEGQELPEGEELPEGQKPPGEPEPVAKKPAGTKLETTKSGGKRAGASKPSAGQKERSAQRRKARPRQRS